jgi:hypothetical protein
MQELITIKRFLPFSFGERLGRGLKKIFFITSFINKQNMKAKIIGLFLIIMSVQSLYAQHPPTETIPTAINNTPEQQEVINWK